MKNKNLAAMQRAIILMEEAQKMYAKALENMKSELIAVSVDNVRTPKESVVVNVALKAEPLPEPPVVIELPKEVMEDVYGTDFDADVKKHTVIVKRKTDEEVMMANKIALLAGLGEVQGCSILVGLKQFYNKDQETPYLSRHHVNVSILDIFGMEIVSRYIHISALGGELEMYLRKKGCLSWDKEFNPTVAWLQLK